MTAVLDHPVTEPFPGSSALDAAVEVHQLLDRVEPPTALSADEYAAVVAQWDRVIHRVEALKLRLVAGANTCGVAAVSGMTGTDAWLAKQTRTSRGDAARQVRLAADLNSGFALTGGALAQGELSPAHAAVIVQADKQLPVGLSVEDRAKVEASLVEKALTADPAELRKLARRALAAASADQAAVDAHEDGLLRDEEADARAKTKLSIFDNGDGTSSGHFTIPTLAASILSKTIEQMTAPRRGKYGATNAQAGPQGDRLDWAQKAGQAFAELLEHLPTDHLHTKVAATVIVMIDHDRLQAAIGAAGLDTGDAVSAGEARRIACGAGILPAVLGKKSLPLDLGMTSRVYTEAQRIALGLKHKTCAGEGCQRPFAWCEIHHRMLWSRGGPTDLANAVPLCGFHHQRIHDREYDHRYHADGSVTFHRRT